MTTLRAGAIGAVPLGEVRGRLVEALGAEAVLDDAAAVEFTDPYATVATPSASPLVVVQPASVEEVVAVVRIASELGVPVWTSSQGRNFGYGGGSPVVDGSIEINMRRMNRILELDEAGGYAILEPGVSFAELHAEIKRRGVKLWVSVPDLGWGSVLGNACVHGMGYTQFGDHAGAVAGMEVVLASGEVVRTGLWSIPNSPLGSRHKRGFGPSLDSMFLQSNFGIVTKMGIWLMPQPEMFVTGSVIVQRGEDIPALIDALAPLMMDGTIMGVPLITSTPDPEGGRCEPDQDTTGLSKRQKLTAVYPPGRVNARIGIYGHREVTRAREAIVREAVKHLPDVVVDLRTYPGDVDAAQVNPLDLVPAGIPNQYLLEMLHKHFGATVGHFDFSPIIPFTGQDAARHERMVMEILDEYDLVAGFAWMAQPRSLVGACMVMFDSANPEEAANARRGVDRMIEKAAEWGWSEYRAHVTVAESVAALYTANDNSLRRLYSTIKDALDPAGVLSPGSHGIWPGSHWTEK